MRLLGFKYGVSSGHAPVNSTFEKLVSSDREDDPESPSPIVKCNGTSYNDVLSVTNGNMTVNLDILRRDITWAIEQLCS